MGRWYEDKEERFERITSDNEEAARDEYYEKLEAEHERGEHDDRRVKDCDLCEVQVDDA